jgi:Immunity protein Imm1
MKPTDRSIPPESTAGHWKLIEGDRELVSGNRWDEIEVGLIGLSETISPPNAIVHLLTPSGDILWIGIAGPRDTDNPGLDRDLARVEWNRASLDPPYIVVVGDPNLSFDDGGVIVLRFDGHWTEILRRNCVPTDVMIRIVKEFFETNTLPKWIGWEQL